MSSMSSSSESPPRFYVDSDEELPKGYHLHESIVDKRKTKRGRIEYLVKWNRSKKLTWEPYKNLKKCIKLIQDYEKRLTRDLNQEKKISPKSKALLIKQCRERKAVVLVKKLQIDAKKNAIKAKEDKSNEQEDESDQEEDESDQEEDESDQQEDASDEQENTPDLLNKTIRQDSSPTGRSSRIHSSKATRRSKRNQDSSPTGRSSRIHSSKATRRSKRNQDSSPTGRSSRIATKAFQTREARGSHKLSLTHSSNPCQSSSVAPISNRQATTSRHSSNSKRSSNPSSRSSLTPSPKPNPASTPCKISSSRQISCLNPSPSKCSNSSLTLGSSSRNSSSTKQRSTTKRDFAHDYSKSDPASLLDGNSSDEDILYQKFFGRQENDHREVLKTLTKRKANKDDPDEMSSYDEEDIADFMNDYDEKAREAEKLKMQRSIEAATTILEQFGLKAERLEKELEDRTIGFDNSRGLEAEKILGAFKLSSGKVFFHIKWKNSIDSKGVQDFVPAENANKNWPQLVIDFYECTCQTAIGFNFKYEF